MITCNQIAIIMTMMIMMLAMMIMIKMDKWIKMDKQRITFNQTVLIMILLTVIKADHSGVKLTELGTFGIF